MEKVMDNDWKVVYENPNEIRISIVKAILEDCEIPAVVLNKKDSAYRFGSYQVYVKQENFIKAIRIIQHELEFE
jgi:hypothetical protein